MKTQNPLIGRFKGSAGGMTGCKIYDKNVLRAKAFEVNNPNTIAQQVQRTYFAELSALVASITEDQLRVLFPSKPKAMSRRNACAKQLSEFYEISGNLKSVSLADLQTIGNAPTMVFGTTTVSIEDDDITVTLDSSVSNNTSINFYHFIAVLVNVSQQKIILPLASAQVERGTLTFSLPSGWLSTDTIHAIPLIINSVTAITSWDSVGVSERPARIE